MSFPFQECWGQIGECAPCRCSSLLSSGSVTRDPFRPAGEAQIFSFFSSSGCSSSIPDSAALQIFSVWGFNRSQPFLYLKTEPCAYRIISSSCYVSPTNLNHSVQHSYSVILPPSVTSIPNAALFNFPTPQFPHKPPEWSAAHLDAVYFLAWVVLAPISACLPTNLCQRVNWSLTVWSSNLCSPEKKKEFPPRACFESKDSSMSLYIWW